MDDTTKIQARPKPDAFTLPRPSGARVTSTPDPRAARRGDPFFHLDPRQKPMRPGEEMRKAQRHAYYLEQVPAVPQMRKSEPVTISIPLDVQFPQLRAQARRFDPLRPARIHESAFRYKSMKDAGRQPSTLLSSYLPRLKHADGTVGGLLIPQAFEKLKQCLQKLVDGIELLPVEHAIMSLVFRGYPAMTDRQGAELIADVSSDEISALRDFSRARLPQFADIAGLAPEGATGTVARRT